MPGYDSIPKEVAIALRRIEKALLMRKASWKIGKRITNTSNYTEGPSDHQYPFVGGVDDSERHRNTVVKNFLFNKRIYCPPLQMIGFRDANLFIVDTHMMKTKFFI